MDEAQEYFAWKADLEKRFPGQPPATPGPEVAPTTSLVSATPAAPVTPAPALPPQDEYETWKTGFEKQFEPQHPSPAPSVALQAAGPSLPPEPVAEVAPGPTPGGAGWGEQRIPSAIAPLPGKEMGTAERLSRHFISGALGTAEGMGGALQWITGGAMGKDFSDYMAGLRKDVTPEGEASFAEQLASGAGSMATFFIPGFGVYRGVGVLSKIAPRAAAWLGSSVSAVTEAATEAGQGYRDELAKGKGEDIASKAAGWTFILNLPVLALTNRLGLFGNEGRTLSRALKSLVAEGSQESLQEVISTWSKDEQQNLKNILTSGAVGALLGGGVGAIAKPLGARETVTEPGTEATTEPISGPLPAEITGVPFDFVGRERAMEALQPPPAGAWIEPGQERAQDALQRVYGIEGGRERALQAMGGPVLPPGVRAEVPPATAVEPAAVAPTPTPSPAEVPPEVAPRTPAGPMGVSGTETQVAATAALGIRRVPPEPRGIPEAAKPPEVPAPPVTTAGDAAQTLGVRKPPTPTITPTGIVQPAAAGEIRPEGQAGREIKPIDSIELAQSPELKRQVLGEIDKQVSSGNLNLIRVDESGVSLDYDKPHGSYFNIEYPGFQSPHAEFERAKGEVHRVNFKPENPLIIANQEYSSGVGALREMVGTETFDILMKRGGIDFSHMMSPTARGTTAGKAALVEQFSKEYPKIDWGKYYDSYEILEGYSGLKAREAGYDSIIQVNKDAPDFSEVVLLKSPTPEAMADYPDLAAKYAPPINAPEVSEGGAKAVEGGALKTYQEVENFLMNKTGDELWDNPVVINGQKIIGKGGYHPRYDTLMVMVEGKEGNQRLDHIISKEAEGRMVSAAKEPTIAPTEPVPEGEAGKVVPEAPTPGEGVSLGGKGETLFRAGEEAALARGLTTDQIQSRLGKFGTVSEVGEDAMGDKYNRGWLVRLNNGQMTFIYESKAGSLELLPGGESLGPDYAALGITSLGPNQRIAGAFKPVSFGSVIELARGEGIRTFDHESWHTIEHWLLTPKEREAIRRQFGDNEEVRAEAYANWNPKEAPNTIFQKILDFFQRITKAITGKITGEDVFAAARSGEFFGRKAMERLPEFLAPRKAKMGWESDPAFEKLALTKALHRGELTLEDYNARYADKYGEWESRKWADNFPDLAFMGVKMLREDGTVVSERKYRVEKGLPEALAPAKYKLTPEGKAAERVTTDPTEPDRHGFIKPLMKPMNYLTDIITGAKKLIAPGAISKEYLQSAHVLRNHLGTFNRHGAETVINVKSEGRKIDKIGVNNPNIPLEENPGMKLASDISMGRPVAPEFEGIARKMQSENAQRVAWMEQVDAPLETVRENYFGMIWTRESRRAFHQAVTEAVESGRGMEAVEGGVGGQTMNLNEWSTPDKAWVKGRVNELMAQGQGTDGDIASYLARRPFKGKEAFRQQKVFDDVMTGVEFGLVPFSNNPVDIFLAKTAEMDRSIYANGAIKEFKDRGDIQFNHVSKSIPEGWAKIEDRYGTVYGPYDPETGARPIYGYWVAKAPVAEIINNSLSLSLYNNPYVGKAFKGFMATGNLLNQFQLMSGFHIGFTAGETQISAGAQVIQDIYGAFRGTIPWGELGRTLKAYPTAIAKFATEGNRVLSEYRVPTVDVPTDVPISSLPDTKEYHTAMVAKAAEIVGGGFTMEAKFRTQQAGKMVKEWYGGQKLKAALRSPVALTEMAMKPIMDFLVPRQKAAVFSELVGRITRQIPGKTLTELRPQLNEAWNWIDGVLGQVRYDRIFMREGAKNAMQALIRAPGWTGGTIERVGGAPVDVIRFIKEWTETGKLPAKLPDRVAYTMSLLGTIVVANGLLNWLFTGDRPKDMDWWAFRTGEIDSKGRQVRFLLPSYVKDLFAWYQAPVHTAVAKTHPLWSMIGELARNKDYYNTLIRDPESSQAQQLMDMGTYSLKQFIPFGIRGMQQIGEYAKFSEEPGRFIAPQFGIMPAPRAYTNTPAQQVIEEYNVMTRSAYSTKEVAAQKRLKTDLRNLAKDGDEEGFREAAKAAMSEGTLTRQQIKAIVDESQAPPGLGRFVAMPVEWQIRAWKKATDQEKEIWQPYFLKKVMSAKPEILIRNRDMLDPVLREMGLDDAADAIQNLKISEKASRFDLSLMGIRKPPPEMGDIDTMDLSMARGISAQEEKLGAGKKDRRKSQKPSRYTALGF